jgi:IS30 family transposase
VLIGTLATHTAPEFTHRSIQLIRRQQRPVRTITAGNGSEISGFRRIERATGTRFFFATLYHAWERGTNENTNGLIRQYLPKGQSLRALTQRDCAVIARRLNPPAAQAARLPHPGGVLWKQVPIVALQT